MKREEKTGCFKKNTKLPGLLGEVEGVGWGRGRRNAEKGGPAELSNQRPNRCSSGDVFKGSFLTTGCARSQVKCSCLEGGGESGIFGWLCSQALLGGGQLDCQILASLLEAGSGFSLLGRNPSPDPHHHTCQTYKENSSLDIGSDPEKQSP